MAQYDFLTFEDISAIHADQLARHGGAEGIVDRNVIESAIAAAQWAIRYDGDIADCAAAYLYHLAASQGFRDGNKRTGVVAAVEFLGRNGYQLSADNAEMYELTMRVANKNEEKETVAEWFRARLEPIP